jgi:hypothetical protein
MALRAARDADSLPFPVVALRSAREQAGLLSHFWCRVAGISGSKQSHRERNMKHEPKSSINDRSFSKA